jgi:hypothetical protein
LDSWLSLRALALALEYWVLVGFRFGLLALVLGYWVLVGFRFGLLTLALGYWLLFGFSGLLYHPV